MILLDTDVMIDILRNYPPAIAWLNSLGDQSVGLPGLVAMELIQGCRNAQEQHRIEAMLAGYTLHWPSEADCQAAFLDFTRHYLSQNVGLLDALIAGTARGLGTPLATFNKRHYGVVQSLQVIEPYVRG